MAVRQRERERDGAEIFRLSYRLSLEAFIYGLMQGNITGDIKEDTRGLDYRLQLI